jgi:hypothetical protein
MLKYLIQNKMKEDRNWVILDLDAKKFLHGYGSKTLRFSKKEIAQEVAEQLFEKGDRFIILNLVESGIKETTI